MPSLANVRIGCWVFILLYWLAASVFQGGAPTLQQFEYTFQRPIDGPNTLQSQRWNFYFWVTALYVMLWAVPLSLAFALEDAQGTDADAKRPRFWRMILHIVITMLELLWFVATFIYGITLWAQANGSTPDNYWNPANDPRWCCVYFNLENHATDPWFPCVNTAACTPGVSASMLVANPVFLYQLWFSFVFIIAFAIDIMLVTCMVWPTYEAHAMAEQSEKRNQPVKSQYRERLLH